MLINQECICQRPFNGTICMSLLYLSHTYYYARCVGLEPASGHSNMEKGDQVRLPRCNQCGRSPLPSPAHWQFGVWRVEENIKCKWGWIDAFTYNSHHIHGGNSSSYPAHRSLLFKLQDYGHVFDGNKKKHSSEKRDLLIRVAFLKTHNNTGQFKICLCGKFLQSVDTTTCCWCWGDPKIKRSTILLSLSL